MVCGTGSGRSWRSQPVERGAAANETAAPVPASRSSAIAAISASTVVELRRLSCPPSLSIAPSTALLVCSETSASTAVCPWRTVLAITPSPDGLRDLRVRLGSVEGEHGCLVLHAREMFGGFEQRSRPAVSEL